MQSWYNRHMDDGGTQTYRKGEPKQTSANGSEDFTEDHISELAGLFSDENIAPDDDDQDTGEFTPVKNEDPEGSTSA